METLYFKDRTANVPIRQERETCFTVALLSGTQSILAFSGFEFALQTERWGSSTGTACMVYESFFSATYVKKLRNFPIFHTGSRTSYVLKPNQVSHINEIFSKIRSELASDYRFKFDLIRIYLVELIHFSLKINVDLLKNYDGPYCAQ